MLVAAVVAIGLLLYNATNYKTLTPQVTFVSIKGERIAADLRGKVTLTPTTFIVDKRGNVVSKIVREPDFRKLHELLEKEPAEPS